MLNCYPRAQYLTWLVILLVLPMPLIILLNTSLLDTASNLFLFDVGIVAYVWWLAIIYLSTRPQWLDRLIGLPAMYFIHAMVGVLSVLAAFVHQTFSFTMHDEIRLTGDAAWYLLLAMIAFAVLMMSGWLVDRFAWARWLKGHLQKLFSHEVSIWLHRLSLVMIGLIWLHVHVIARIAILTPFMVLFDLYTVYCLGVYAWQKLILAPEGQLHGKVISNRALSATVQEVRVQLTLAVDYQAGDFFFVRFKDPAVSKEKHPFSVASNPSESPDEVTFVIQAVGDFTRQVKHIAAGAEVILEGPFGRFASIVEESPAETPLVLYGLGSGIAPLMSMARHYAPTRPVHIIWSAKGEEEFYFDQTFANWTKELPQLSYHGKPHRFSQEELTDILTPEERKQALFFVVGSASVLLQVEKNLQTLGVPKAHIHDERLTM